MESLQLESLDLEQTGTLTHEVWGESTGCRLFLFPCLRIMTFELMVPSVPDTNTYVTKKLEKCSIPAAFHTEKKWNPVDELNLCGVSPLTLTFRLELSVNVKYISFTMAFTAHKCVIVSCLVTLRLPLVLFTPLWFKKTSLNSELHDLWWCEATFTASTVCRLNAEICAPGY